MTDKNTDAVSSNHHSSSNPTCNIPSSRPPTETRLGKVERDASTSERPSKSAGQMRTHAIYGKPVTTTSSGSFPTVGSTLGPFFVCGQLGKGTFSSVHKCIQMLKHEIVAAKVELQEFQQSGVLEGEATMLDYLHQHMPTGTVPQYYGHYKSGNASAIVMEYLEGYDMYQLRETVVTKYSRRIAVADAVHFCADVWLPLLQQLHYVGVVHRDVKPSNCMRKNKQTRDFCLVDFGLAKSIVVPPDSPWADSSRPWNTNAPWLQSYTETSSTAQGYYRIPRDTAEFRGTSMYASLRIHQLKDYCPRDDVWSLLYVFCDLVSGGLPWMQQAANRDRQACHNMKTRIHGEDGAPDETHVLLMGDEYHVAKFRRERQIAAGKTEGLGTLPEPLALSKDDNKVNLLRTAFAHVQKLEFSDTPDYELIGKCLRGFLIDPSNHPPVPRIDLSSTAKTRTENRSTQKKSTPTWDIVDSIGAIDTEVFDDIVKDENEEISTIYDPFARLPIEMRYKIAQMDYNAGHSHEVPLHVALRDWMNIVLPLLYEDWDAKQYEEGGHRTTTDGFRRDCFLSLLELCQRWANVFQMFQNPEWLYTDNVNDDEQKSKKRKIVSTMDGQVTNEMISFSRALYGLQAILYLEKKKKTAPPVRISFTGNS